MDVPAHVHLRIVATETVHPHEVADPSRQERIHARIRQDGVLRDPLMVAAVPDYEGYVLLDGTNRRGALVALGFPWVLVQIIDYADEHAVSLRTWCHATDLPLDEIVEQARAIPGIAITPLAPLSASDALHARGTVAVVLDRREQHAIARSGDGEVSRTEQLRALVDLYEHRMERIDCAAEEVEERAQALGHDAAKTLIAFPPISRSQVVTMAMRGLLIPAGITRHVIHSGRALRVNVPLELLRGDDLEGANAALADHLRGLHPRVYSEPTVLFDS